MTYATRIGASRRGGAAPIWAALGRAAAWPLRVHRARMLLHQLARLDAHGLRDIGLTPGDLRDAAALALDADASSMLRGRAEERRRRYRLPHAS